MKRRLIERPIFQKPNGYWWAWSFLKGGYVCSLHTRDKATAQIKYNECLQQMREAIENDPVD